MWLNFLHTEGILSVVFVYLDFIPKISTRVNMCVNFSISEDNTLLKTLKYFYLLDVETPIHFLSS